MKQKILKHTKQYTKEFKKHSLTAIVSAIGFLIALSWRDFIVDVVNKFVVVLGITEQVYFFRFLTAVIITVLGVIGIIIISKIK